MKYKDPTTGDFKTIKIRATDELPVGSEIDVDDNTEIPVGWEETDDFNSYSTTEKKIGTWIDGKPIYRIVASINLQNYTSWTNLVHISNLKRVINIYGSLNNINIPRYESSSYFTQFLYENNYIKVMCNGNTGSGYLVIEYTKTTD